MLVVVGIVAAAVAGLISAEANMIHEEATALMECQPGRKITMVMMKIARTVTRIVKPPITRSDKTNSNDWILARGTPPDEAHTNG